MKRYIVGRDSKSVDIPITSGEGADSVSRQHLEITVAEDGQSYYVVDRGSSNHTYVLTDGRWESITQKEVSLDAHLCLGKYITTVEGLLKMVKAKPMKAVVPPQPPKVEKPAPSPLPEATKYNPPKVPEYQQPQQRPQPQAVPPIQQDSPKNVDAEIKLKYAGFWLRAVAMLIDGVLLKVVSFLIGAMFNNDVAVLVAIVFQWLYFSLMESSTYQGTFGKMAMGIKVTNIEGNRVGFWQATGRYFGKILSFFMLLIGFIMVAFTEKKQGLHDIMAGCLVVKK